MTTLDLVAYYVNLLIIQYSSKPRAMATIAAQITPALLPTVSTQTITFSDVPVSGTYVLSWDELSTASINWNDDAATIRTKLRAILGLELVTVAGSAALGFTVTFAGVAPVAELLVVESSSLDTGSPTITETDDVLLTQIQNAFNIDDALGDQLDVLGDYVGVTRTAQTSSGPITLDDDDFRVLIRMAVLTNSAQSDLSSIQDFLFAFFNGQMRVFDYQNMRMNYMMTTDLGSIDLVEMFIAQGLLPRPMGVQLSIIFAPDINNFFGFVSYESPVALNISPFNTYEDYQTDRPWLLYENSIAI